MVKVKFCPTTKQEWETAAIRKNCNNTAAEQSCSDAKKFVYHCVINGFQDETLEVCAPQKLISGMLIDLLFVRYVEILNLNISHD